MKIGKVIRSYRMQKNWSLPILSEKTGIPASTLSDFETDKYLSNAEKLKKLSKVLNVTVDELLSEYEYTS